MNAPLDWAERAAALAADFAIRAPRHDAEGSVPRQNFADLAQAGFLALAAPRALGGAQASMATLGQVVGAVGHGDPATALVLTMQYLQHRSMLHGGRAWPEAVARRLVQEATTEVALVNALRVEPELGSPARGGLPATVARRTPEGWRLSGHKVYSTGAPVLRWYAVWARTDEDPPRLGNFLVRAGAPGSRIVETWDHLGLRASGSHDVLFDDVALPPEAALDLRSPADWAAGDPELQADMAVLLGSLYTGVARAARDWVVDFLRQRKPASLGAALATLPRAQERVGAIEEKLHTNRRLIASLARDIDEGVRVPAVESSLVKTTTTENAVQAVEWALSLSSNHGLSRHHPLERHWRDVQCGRIHTPQVDSVHTGAGRRALGL